MTGLLKRTVDVAYTIRFLLLLVTPWKKTKAYKLGIIDENGEPLKRVADLTAEELKYYTSFIRLVFNVKRLIFKVPVIGKSILLNYVAALYLIKEETGLTENEIEKIIIEACNQLNVPYNNTKIITEEKNNNTWMLNENGELVIGSYRLKENVIHPKTGDLIGKRGSVVEVIKEESSSPIGTMWGIPVYSVRHVDTNQSLVVSINDICR